MLSEMVGTAKNSDYSWTRWEGNTNVHTTDLAGPAQQDWEGDNCAGCQTRNWYQMSAEDKSGYKQGAMWGTHQITTSDDVDGLLKGTS